MNRRRNQDQNNYGNDYLINFDRSDNEKNKIDKNERIPSDEEIRSIWKDKDGWVKALVKYQFPENRRRILYLPLNLSNDQLREMTGWGKSTITNLTKKSEVSGKDNWESKFNFLSQFGVMVRGTLSLLTAKRKLNKLKWDDTLFRIVESYGCIDVEYLFKQIDIAQKNHTHYIYGYVLKIGEKNLDIRFERRDGIIIIELTNQDLELFQILTEILNNTTIEWKFSFTPTIYENKEFLVFVGNADENQMGKLVNNELCWCDKWYSLQISSKVKVSLDYKKI